MIRQLSLSLALTLAFAGAVAAEKINYTVYGPYFESNKSGLKGDNTGSSYIVLADQASFDKVFGSGRVMKQKPNLLPMGFFEKNLVIAAIKRGPQIYGYDVSKVEAEGEVVRIEYKATAKGRPGAARFASPLIVGIPKGNYKTVEFAETTQKDNKDVVTKTRVDIGK